MKQLPEEFKEFLSLLNAAKVEYLIVGGWALGVHGYIRATGDIDVWVGLKEDNIQKLLIALKEFGVPSGVTKEYFSEKGNVLRMGVPPLRIEIITEASGIDFYESYPKRIAIIVEDVAVQFIAYEDLVKNKQSTGRLKDLADLESLGENPGVEDPQS